MDPDKSEMRANEIEIVKESDEIPKDVSNVKIVASPNDVPFSKKIEEIVELMRCIGQRLKDLSIEQRAQVAQVQWKSLEDFKTSTKKLSKPTRFWQKSLFARTYFTDKDLDDSFQNVMKHTLILFDHLNNFKGKVENFDECTTDEAMDTENVRKSQSDEIAATKAGSEESALSNNLPIEKSKSSTIVSDQDALDNLNDVKHIQQSFTDLIRSKIEFDAQFLNFNATLSKNCYAEDFHYLYEICANSNVVLGQTSLSIDKHGSFNPDNKELKRNKRFTGKAIEKPRKRPLRRSTRLACDDEVQIIRTLRRRKSA